MTSFNPSTSSNPPIEQILANRHRWRLCWEEPLPVLSKEGERTATRRIYMLVDDAIDAQRHISNIVKPDLDLEDSRLLRHFMTVHNVRVVWVREEYKS